LCFTLNVFLVAGGKKWKDANLLINCRWDARIVVILTGQLVQIAVAMAIPHGNLAIISKIRQTSSSLHPSSNFAPHREKRKGDFLNEYDIYLTEKMRSVNISKYEIAN
jgi:hypothetical protein